jgi:hypothetical protein
MNQKNQQLIESARQLAAYTDSRHIFVFLDTENTAKWFKALPSELKNDVIVVIRSSLHDAMGGIELGAAGCIHCWSGNQSRFYRV